MNRWLTFPAVPMPGGDYAEREAMLRKNAEAMGQPIYDSETGEMVEADGTRRPS